MRTTIDKAGRVVVPKELRDRIGLVPGEVDVVVDGAGLRIEPVAADRLVERDGHLVTPHVGTAIADDLVQDLRASGQR